MPNEQQLSAVLSEFARTMATDFPVQAILDHLVENIVELMPITGAGVTLISPGSEPHYVAASDPAALRYERLQSELNEGPCLAAYQSGAAVEVPDLAGDGRFPTFNARALAAGLQAVFTFPLRHGDSQLGALDLYRDSPGGLSPRAMAAAQTLADVAAAYLLNAQARADLQRSADRARELSLHDGLTGLPNRILMLERLEHAFLRSRRTGKVSAVLFVDLDGFKEVNDRYGHDMGDDLLIALSRRLSGILRPPDTVARLHGDEFVILCEDLDSPVQAVAIVARLDAAVSRPFVLSGIEVAISASVGVAFADRDNHAPEQVLRDADTAMYEAKRMGGGRQRIFDQRYQHLAVDHAALEHDLRGALDRREMHVEYQPLVCAATGQITGFEALLRWTHPTQGLVPPATFIPLAERCGLITEIGKWVLEQAWTDHSHWRIHRQNQELTMAVNVSADQLMSAGFASTVAQVLRSADTPPNLLVLEMTESLFVRDNDRAMTALTDLKRLGVVLALDDFGTGYSSLGYLKRFPVDIVKVDRTFVADLGQSSASHIIVGAVAELSHALGMTVVAEGVETVEQRIMTRELGCDNCQGYYFARPMTANRIESLIHPRNGDSAPVLPVQAVSGPLPVPRVPIRQLIPPEPQFIHSEPQFMHAETIVT